MSCRKVKDVIETGLLYRVRDRVWGEPVYCPDGGRQKGGASLVQVFMGTWEPGVPMLREKPGRKNLRAARVLMWGAGEDQPAVVMRFGNEDGAKGLNCPALFVSQPARGGVIYDCNDPWSWREVRPSNYLNYQLLLL